MTEEDQENIFREAIRGIQRFIEHKPRTSFEVISKLKKSGYEDSIINIVISQLKKNGVLDDERFLNVYAEELLRKKYGYKRILLELSKKGIDKDLVEKFKDDYPYETEADRARDACLVKYRKNSNSENRNDREKIVSYLLRRGFSKDIAEAAARSLSERV